MTHGRKTGGRDFQPGHKFSPGRPLIPPDLKEVRTLKKDEAERLITMLMTKTVDELKAIREDKNTPAMHVVIANIIIAASISGDNTRMEFLFNRTIGRVLEKIEHTVPTPFVIRKPNGDIEMGIKDPEDQA